MSKQIEEIVLECGPCNKETDHLYLGDYGVLWKPVHVYSCLDCHNKVQSLVKLYKEKDVK